jgi:LysR family nitrogen assimilation transcriptional regulator
MVDLQHLRLFVRISELNSFTKAAVVLGIAQPTVSRIIKEMEETWGGHLFYRTGRGVTLSELGEVALARAKSLLYEADQMSEELRAYGRLPSGNVSFGLPPYLVPVVVPKLVNQLRRETPSIKLRIYQGFSDQIERWRSAGDIEVGIHSRYREGETEIDGALFASFMVLIGPRNAPTLPTKIEFADLARYPLVLPAMPNGVRMHLEEIARRLRISLKVVVDTDSIIAQKQVCIHCGCYTINAPQTVFEDGTKDGYTSSLIVNPLVQRYVSVVTTQQRPLSRAAREVANRVTAILKRHRLDSGGLQDSLQTDPGS